MMKKIKDGKLAVLYSPGFGAGWYTWHGIEELLFDPVLVDMVLDNAGELAMRNYCEETYGTDNYYGGLEDLTVAFVDTGDKFRIEEYDGAESVMCMNDYRWFEA